MTYTGHVENGVVVFDGVARPEEGATVRVEDAAAPAQPSAAQPGRPGAISPEYEAKLREWYKDWEKESAAFDRMLPELLKSKANRFVAVYGGRVVDEDEDQFTLAGKVHRRYPQTFVLIQQVLEHQFQDFI
jgi:hypothetical protein